MESIAIIGIGCRFPGAENPQQFWQLLSNGINAISEVPPERWNVDQFYSPEPGTPGKMSSRYGGFLDNVDQFDAGFFGISQEEAERIDPQQRLVLEVAWEALENAGIAPHNITDTQTGVMIGIGNYDYGMLQFQDIDSINAHNGAGSTLSIAANRLSYLLNLKGPSLVVETACSSSLVAIHLACKSLVTKECDLCIVGAVSLMLSPVPSVIWSQAGVISADGRCKTFDASADGYVRGEGCGVVILKRLTDAIKDNDNIQAVIRGTAINQDGLSNGLTSPNGPSQQEVIRQALKNANVEPAQISYVEVHGTGTSLGDTIEFKALKNVLMESRKPDEKCFLGAVKTNIGHLELASGMASLLKVIVSLQHQQIPPHLHLQKLNPYISLDKTCFAIPTKLENWDNFTGSRLAGISTFGIGGTNAHIIVEEANYQQLSQKKLSAYLLTISAKTETALRELAKRYEKFILEDEEIDLGDICYTAHFGRSHFDHRLAIIGTSHQDFHQQLNNFLTNKPGNYLAGKLTGKKKRKAAVITSEEHLQILQELQQYYIEGLTIDWQDFYSSFHQNSNYNKVILPNYPWQRSPYWFKKSNISTNTEKSQQYSAPKATLNPQKTSHKKADELISWLRDYASKRINSRLIDERRSIPPYIILDFGNKGLLGMQVPEEYGGLELNYYDTFRVFEQLAAIDMTLAAFVGVHYVLGTRPILNYANEKTKSYILPLIAQGRELISFAITEPGAGSNPRAISTTAKPTKNGWVLNGQKEWIGTGSWSGFINVFAQMLDENNHPIGISSFVISQNSPGLEQGPEALTMGMRGMVQNSIYFHDVPVTQEQLLGKIGFGMDVAQDAMFVGRLGLGAISLGGMKRCAQLMLRYSSRRHVSTGRLLDNPITLVKLSDLTAAITTLETLVFKIAKLLDIQFPVPEAAYIACKTSGPEFLWQAADQLVQLLGGRGYIESNIAPQILRDARLLRIFEGPTETLNMFLGSRVMNNFAELDKFLCDGLESPETSQELEYIVSKIKKHFSRKNTSFNDQQTALKYAHIRTGEIVTWGILLAAVESAYANSNTETLKRAFNWAKLQFEQKAQQILHGIPGELIVSNSASITQQISDYIATIGDIEQTLAGENHQLDKFLKQEFIQDNQISITPIVEEVKQPLIVINSIKSETSASIENWIENWLVKKLKIDADTIDIDTSFADYGIDSVTAVELAQDLEEWLQSSLKSSLEVTILWNFPTIRSLANYLNKEIGNDLPITTKMEDERVLPIPKLSQPENDESKHHENIDDAIASELAALEKLLTNF
ncbi:acyl-CoA dehydrogenase family protein [Anabaena sp. FACHB-1237]|uniref:beta-ketoacyl synthase N-terminal-like domain-containing protein n=1 Tax=Anabaena sp. FACHB-1237 TaxID=2692769 RepID=UPI0016805308|nr:beta-ketoacyl synthase N-terminal-like domain-containing protein [Anabaena sp. FACHB-1237]MBD2136214.1 acyl-CoA dehydrogenase family protein [Anabaena sp. FACHB-1237]